MKREVVISTRDWQVDVEKEGGVIQRLIVTFEDDTKLIVTPHSDGCGCCSYLGDYLEYEIE